jgi:hypothetical protein
VGVVAASGADVIHRKDMIVTVPHVVFTERI